MLLPHSHYLQDDAHIFCTEEQLYSEIKECLDFIQHVYKVLNFPYALKLSTRPESFMGEIELWNKCAHDHYYYYS